VCDSRLVSELSSEILASSSSRKNLVDESTELLSKSLQVPVLDTGVEPCMPCEGA
jgi:hypothetical protein